jgi:hypothetical protein
MPHQASAERPGCVGASSRAHFLRSWARRPRRFAGEREGLYGGERDYAGAAATSYPIMASTCCVAKPSAKVGALPLAMRCEKSSSSAQAKNGGTLAAREAYFA